MTKPAEDRYTRSPSVKHDPQDILYIFGLGITQDSMMWINKLIIKMIPKEVFDDA